jgi:hypothetical protein
MEELTKHISAFPLIALILFAVLLFVVLRIIRIITPNLIKREKARLSILRNLNLFELFIWILFILLIIPSFFKLNISLGIIISLILVIAILFIGWYAGRDFIAGYILRANIGFTKGARINSNEIEGIISEFYVRNLKLINDTGETLIIPYSNLIGKSLIIRNEDKERTSKHIRLNIKHKEENYDELIAKLKFMIMTHPKALLTPSPRINIVSQIDNITAIDITISARNTKGLAEIESFIAGEFGEGV